SIEARIQAIGMHLSDGHADQIVQGGAAIQGVLDVEFALGRAEAGDGQDGRDGAPAHVFATGGQVLVEQGVEFEKSPQSPSEPDIAEVAEIFEANAAKLNENFLLDIVVRRRRIEEGRLRSIFERKAFGKLGPAVLLRWFQLAKVGDDALARALGGAVRFDQGPIGVGLASLAAFAST
ncbi:MAG: hypothetical protein AAB288_14290, partial [Acidobacteriota bacterium]